MVDESAGFEATAISVSRRHEKMPGKNGKKDAMEKKMPGKNGTQLSRGSIAFAVGDFLELSARTGE